MKLRVECGTHNNPLIPSSTPPPGAGPGPEGVVNPVVVVTIWLDAAVVAPFNPGLSLRYFMNSARYHATVSLIPIGPRSQEIVWFYLFEKKTWIKKINLIQNDKQFIVRDYWFLQKMFWLRLESNSSPSLAGLQRWPLGHPAINFSKFKYYIY